MARIVNVKTAMQHLTIIGYQKLKEDYPAVTPMNLTSDLIYSHFFKASLIQTSQDLKGITIKENKQVVKYYQAAIKVLLRVIQNNHKTQS